MIIIEDVPSTPPENVYLSGWEYNRLLQDDPLAPRNTALPAEILWNGSAALWLFRHAYCSKEAFTNETFAADELGWATGRIFEDLEKADVIRVCDWQRDLDARVHARLARHHKQILGPAAHSESLRCEIRESLKAGRTAELDAVKNALLEPVTTALNCVHGVSPNSLRNWFPNEERDAASPVQALTTALARPVAARLGHSGLVVCQAPSESVSPTELHDQQSVEQLHERPMIPDLLAGDGDFSGESGFEEYVRRLHPYRRAYAPLSEALSQQWRDNRDRLFRLRELAEQLIWPTLHGEWLPELYSDPSAVGTFLARVERMLRHPRIAELADRTTRVGIGTARATAVAVGQVLATFADAPVESRPVIALASERAATHLHQMAEGRMPLALFYQRASKL